jgi:predicted flavoprotein YhiN
MAAEVLATEGVAVTVYDHMPTPGRKFLMAGRGGLNLTHSEELPRFLSRYGNAEPHLRPAIEAFPPTALIAWCEGLGQSTFVGTSGRVFPRAMKASPLLRAWLARLRSLNVAFRPRHRWVGWNEANRLLFETPDGPTAVEASATIFALGGASWPRLGSDGHWTTIFAKAGIMPAELGALIKNLPVRLTATAPIERAISTVGGVAFEELDGHFMLRKKPGSFIAGEMLDWEAPTGGYLLQGCFSTGAAAARGALAWFRRSPGD